MRRDSTCPMFLVALTTMLVAALATSAVAQAAGGGNSELQQKVAALKQSAQENQQRLHQYTWTETQQLTLKGDAKPPKQFQCQYGPDGKVQKTPVGDTSQQPQQEQGGRRGRNDGALKQRVVEKKTAEMKDYMGQVQSVISLYVPPNPQRMQQAFQQHKVSIASGTEPGITNLVFKDYAQPGDQMTVSFNTAVKKISNINVNTYLDDPKQVVTLAVKFAELPDGTNYVQQSVLNATAKELMVTTTNANYAKLAQ
jgi:hypothetical protein